METLIEALITGSRLEALIGFLVTGSLLEALLEALTINRIPSRSP